MTFYLGRRLAAGDTPGDKVLYKPKDLTTHGLVFGMTGSGKTGLCVGLLEEASRRDIPVIAIDPKGDLTNLALAWPGLPAERFAAWIDPSKVEGSELSREDLGVQLADVWRKGLAADEVSDEALATFRKRTAITIYTPGSTAGVPVSMLDKFEPPPAFATMPDEDRADLVSGVVSAVLGLIDVDADPLQSREFILVSNIITRAWNRGQSLDLPALIRAIPAPSFDTLGVFPLDEFIPPKTRQALAMKLNALVASPAFQPWLKGEPLSIDELFSRGPNGTRTSIFSIAHLDDTERMSFVALLLDRIIGWMRGQPGTGDLRALLYMDEVFGYLPPYPKNPPTKRPLLTLLKQARAYGLGTLLATQNPVDIDYKAITNAGCWWVGKLQTEQDKDRILDGLLSASGSGAPTRAELSRRISSLRARQFLLQNAHATEHVTFKTRFVMSFLRGPMTKQEIARLKEVDFYNHADVTVDRSARKDEAIAPSKPPAPGDQWELVRRVPGSEPPVVMARFDDDPARPAGPEVAELDLGPAPASRGPIEAAPGWGASEPRPQPATSPLRARFLARSALVDPAVRVLFGVRADRAVGGLHYRPALHLQARVALEGSAIGRVHRTLSRVVFPIPASPDGVAWAAADGEVDERLLGPSPEIGATLSSTPPWVLSPRARQEAERVLVEGFDAGLAFDLATCPPLRRTGRLGEPLEAFRGRMTAALSQATVRATTDVGNTRRLNAALFDKQLEEMKELLRMDQRELAYLKETGDTEGFQRARSRTEWRLGEYRKLLRERTGLLNEADRRMADVELTALERLDSCRIERVAVVAGSASVESFGVLWVPNR